MSRQLWRPATESDGVPLDVLTGFMSQLNEWREAHLGHVGVSNFQAEWDFVSAVTACMRRFMICVLAVGLIFIFSGASDATYHIMWIILFNALDDFGIREANDGARMGTPESALPLHAEIEDRKRKVFNEALHGALRIAGLVRVRVFPARTKQALMEYMLFVLSTGRRLGDQRLLGARPFLPAAIRPPFAVLHC